RKVTYGRIEPSHFPGQTPLPSTPIGIDVGSSFKTSTVALDTGKRANWNRTRHRGLLAVDNQLEHPVAVDWRVGLVVEPIQLTGVGSRSRACHREVAQRR